MATAIAHTVPWTAIAGIGHWQLGSVDIALSGNLPIGSLPGIYRGSHGGVRIPEPMVQTALAALLLFVGANFIF